MIKNYEIIKNLIKSFGFNFKIIHVCNLIDEI
jgi:CRISPR/Cas system-associated protein Cas7 (RAMP superfamily)